LSLLSKSTNRLCIVDNIIPSFEVDRLSPPFQRLLFGGEIIGVSDGSNPFTLTRLPPVKSSAIDQNYKTNKQEAKVILGVPKTKT
jgi:hypothetical protein